MSGFFFILIHSRIKVNSFSEVRTTVSFTDSMQILITLLLTYLVFDYTIFNKIRYLFPKL